MSEPATNEPPTASDLSGVPGLGPVRRRLLAESGITTRAALAQATVEQIVSVTGMPRTTAEQVAEFVAVSSPPAPNSGGAGREGTRSLGLPVGRDSPNSSPPARPVLGAEGLDTTAVIPASGEDAPQTTRLERAALRAQTAIADASRRAEPDSKLHTMLLRFARLADELPRRVTPQTRGGVLKRITERIEAISERLEAVATPGRKQTDPLGSKRAKRLQQRLKRTRDSIKRTLKTSASN